MNLYRPTLLALLAVYATTCLAQSVPPQAKTDPGGNMAPSSRADAYFDYTMGHIYEQQYKKIYRLETSDSESALWLARLYRLRNEHDQAEQVLRTVLKDEPENEAAVEQLTQLLLDQGKLAQAVALLENLNSRTPSATLLDLLGDAYTQTKNLPKAEEAYRKAVDLDSSELSHLRGLGQTLLSEEKFSDALTVYQKLADLMPDDSDIYLRIGQI